MEQFDWLTHHQYFINGIFFPVVGNYKRLHKIVKRQSRCDQIALKWGHFRLILLPLPIFLMTRLTQNKMTNYDFTVVDFTNELYCKVLNFKQKRTRTRTKPADTSDIGSD